MPEVVLPVSGACAEDAVVLARPYLHLPHDGLVPLVGVQRRGERAVATWADVAGGPLPPRLTAQQTVTVGRAIARALASLHARALVHGAVDGRAVVRDADGRPRLAGAGEAIWAGADAAPADDVHGLARVLAGLLVADGSADAAAVRAALAGALSSHPAARPSASGLAEALGAAAPPAPLPRHDAARRAPAQSGARRSSPLRRPWPRGGVRVVGALVVAGTAAWLLGRATAAPRHEPRPAPAAGARAWDPVVRAITAARWDAFVRTDAARLVAADVTGSPAYRVDAQRVAAFAAAHAHVRGAPPTPAVARVLHSGNAVAEVVVVEGVPAYDEVADAGRVLAHHDPEPPVRWRVTLVRTPAGWRTQEAAPA